MPFAPHISVIDAVGRVPPRLADSSSTPVRITTKAATTYTTYLVAFYTAIAVLLLFSVVDHLL